jgi:hypothetical protein
MWRLQVVDENKNTEFTEYDQEKISFCRINMLGFLQIISC